MKPIVLAAVLLALAGCERETLDMAQQPRYGPGEGSPLFPDGKASRPPPPNTVVRAMGDLAATSSGRRGTEEAAERAAAYARQTLPPNPPPQMLQRGRERFTIYCLPCHGAKAQGDGPVVQRGFPSPPPLTLERLRAAEDRHFFNVITNGHGVMFPYADRVTPQDRWAIVAWIRTLQKESQ